MRDEWRFVRRLAPTGKIAPVASRFNFPLFLTWLRIVAIPAFVAVLYFPEEWLTERQANVISMWIFIGAAITDWLDGWLARRWNQTTSFGAFLDPVADKLMVAAALIVLTEKGLVDPFASLIIIGREITISALREWMAEIGQRAQVRVAALGKVKTTLQIVAIVVLLYQHDLEGLRLFHVGETLLVAAAVLTIWSAIMYVRAAWPALREQR